MQVLAALRREVQANGDVSALPPALRSQLEDMADLIRNITASAG